MKKNLFILCTLSFLISCNSDFDKVTRNTDQQLSEVKVINGRLSFPSTSSFFSTLIKLDRMNEGQLREWSKSYKFASLKNSIDTITADSISMKRFPNSHQMVLNENGEVLIGDTIVWYHGNGKKYFFPHSNEDELTRIKKGGKCDMIGAFVISNSTSIKSRSNSTDKFWLNTGVDARWQKQFNSYKGLRKYVNEIYQAWDGNYGVLYLRIKLEWWGASSHDWHPAGETRTISYSVTYNVYLVWGTANYNGAPLTYYGSYNDSYQGSQDKVLYLASDYLTYNSVKTWYVDISGSISQSMQYDYSSNAWTCVGYPLW